MKTNKQKPIEKLVILELGKITTSSTGGSFGYIPNSIFPESMCDRKLSEKLNEIIDQLNNLQKKGGEK